jgi:PAS domain S-box-containing protein
MIRSLSIAAKLRLLMMLTATVALLLACGAFVIADFRTFHEILLRDSETLAEVVASNSAASLMFHDAETATEILGGLRAKPAVIGACIFDTKGNPFAHYDAPGGIVFKPGTLDFTRRGHRSGDVEIFRDVVFDGRKLGTLYIVSADNVSADRVKQYIAVAAGILILSLLVAFVLSSRLQRLISAPITELARVANEVTAAKHYAARVTLPGEPADNEIGKLISGFNAMLAEIERRDEQLQSNRDDLERQVANRTAELLAMNVQLRAARDAAENAAEANADLGRRKKLILDSAAEGIFGLDSNGIVTFMNRSAAHMLGLPVAEIVGQRLHDVLHPDESRTASIAECPICSDTIAPAVRVGKRSSFVHRGGRTIPVEYTSSTMIDPSQRPSGVVVTFRDITERLAVDRMKDEFVSTVSHELRTPLTSIRGALGLLASGLIGNVGDRAQRMLDIAVSNTDRLVRLINDILDLERIDSGRVELNRKVCDAADLMTASIDVIQALADRAGVRVELEPVHETLWADNDRVVQTLTNLLSNAVKFSTRGSTVRLTGSNSGDVFTFVVEDQGRGIPASHLESVFERFKQVDSSDSRNKNGTGLGLAICRSIVSAHGGRIWAESEEGNGTTFRFTIPLQPHASAPIDEQNAPVARNVLICGEEPERIACISSMLETNGFTVVTSRSLEDLVRTAAETRPQAILIDFLDPEESSWHFIEALKANPSVHDVPVVIAAGSPQSSFDEYADLIAGWVHRPCNDAEIVKAVAAVCDEPMVLVVEDDVDLARVITASLHSRGIQTRHAVTGREAIARCGEIVPRVIVLDLVLPDLDGFAIVEWLKHNSKLSRTPVVVYSAHEVTTADQERLRLGPTEFLTKSRVSIEEFQRRVIGLVNSIAA